MERHCFNPRAHVGRDYVQRSVLSHKVTFQSTRPRGARPNNSTTSSRCVVFQSTRPRGARHECHIAQVHTTVFQSTRPRGARPLDALLSDDHGSFNPRAHVGRDSSTCALRNSCVFQSTRPRGARHAGTAVHFLVEVSIHAPTWGATIFSGTLRFASRVSIHAPTWGATLMLQFVNDEVEVSIHAPTWGATRSRLAREQRT